MRSGRGVTNKKTITLPTIGYESYDGGLGPTTLVLARYMVPSPSSHGRSLWVNGLTRGPRIHL